MQSHKHTHTYLLNNRRALRKCGNKVCNNVARKKVSGFLLHVHNICDSINAISIVNKFMQQQIQMQPEGKLASSIAGTTVYIYMLLYNIQT